MKRHTLPVFVAVVACLSQVGFAQPSLTHALPGAVMPNQTVDLKLMGDKFGRPLSVWTSFPAQVQLLDESGNPDEKQIRCRLTLSDHVPVGIGGIVVANEKGVSDTLWILVDDLPSHAEHGSNHSLEQADEIQLPIAVDGKTQSSKSDFFQFEVEAGQRVSLEVYARRIASLMDPVILLRDQNGRELAYADDDKSIGVDCRLQYEFKEAGHYIVELRDNQFRGNQRYRLRIGDFPLVSSAFPLGAQRGESTELTFTGPCANEVQAAKVELAARHQVRTTSIGARYRDGVSSAIVRIAASDVPEIAHDESNSASDEWLDIELPVAVNGILNTAGDTDGFQFQAEKGQRLAVQCQSRSLGSPAYVQVELVDAQGKSVARTKVTDADEQQLSHQFKSSGVYRLTVTELLGRGGPEFSYRVEMQFDPGFNLALKLTKGKKPVTRERFQIIAPDDGAFSIDITCNRTGYNGRVELAARTPAGPLRVYNNILGEKQKETRLVVLPPAGADKGRFLPVQITGTALVGDQEITQIASTRDMLQAKWPHLMHPPDWHDGLLCVAVGPRPDELFSTEISAETVYLPLCTGKAEFSLEVKRAKKGMVDPLIVALEGLPDEISYSVKQEGKVPDEKYKVTLASTGEISLGTHPFRVVSFGELNTLGYQDVIKRVALRAVVPLTVEVPPVEIVAGDRAIVAVSISRYFGARLDRHPVQLRWLNLPEGVTVPKEITVNAEAYSTKIELSAAPDASTGSFDDISVEAISKFEGQDIQVSSHPIRIKVVAPPSN